MFVILLGFLYTRGFATPISNRKLPASSQLPVDAIYVLGMEHCESRWNNMFAWAKENNLTITPIYGAHYQDLDLQNPPIPITGLMESDAVKSGQVACTTTHIKAWRDAFRNNHSRVIVLEDDVRMTAPLMERLPSLLKDADQGSVRRGQPWHYIYLRTFPTVLFDRYEVWHNDIRVAPPGWGTAAYVASRAGIRYLLTRISSYSFPLDVQIERLQKGYDNEGAQFVALETCGFDEQGRFRVGCSHNIRELSRAQKGNCAYSATQAGKTYTGKQMPGVVK